MEMSGHFIVWLAFVVTGGNLISCVLWSGRRPNQPHAAKYERASNQLKRGDLFPEIKPARQDDQHVTQSRKWKRLAQIELRQDLHLGQEARDFDCNGCKEPGRCE